LNKKLCTREYRYQGFSARKSKIISKITLRYNLYCMSVSPIPHPCLTRISTRFHKDFWKKYLPCACPTYISLNSKTYQCTSCLRQCRPRSCNIVNNNDTTLILF